VVVALGVVVVLGCLVGAKADMHREERAVSRREEERGEQGSRRIERCRVKDREILRKAEKGRERSRKTGQVFCISACGCWSCGFWRGVFAK
jgi:hypothetical protein